MSVLKQLKFAVIGCGAVSNASHLPALNHLESAELVALVDLDYGLAKALAKDFKALAFQNHQELKGLVDAAIVATPNSTHQAISCDLLEMGIHAICEKPLALNKSSAHQIYSTARKNDTRIMAGQSRRFGAQISMINQIIRKGLLGKITALEASLGGDISGWNSKTPFREGTRKAGGGVLYDAGIHLVDLAIWLLQEGIADLNCSLEYINKWAVEDNAYLRLKTISGTDVRLACSFTWGLSRKITVRGERGWIKADLNDTSKAELFVKSRLCEKSGIQIIEFPPNDPYSTQIQHFCEAILNDTPFLIREKEILQGLDIINDCFQ